MRVTQKCAACGLEFETTCLDGFRLWCSVGCEVDVHLEEEKEGQSSTYPASSAAPTET